ncbi:hypothetical protein BDW42DRAFT_90954 [Aspergillus taichungensis]|uniref:Uncharacterized protein n=1 Tax=Aspergillus taichungensis TaxID=482145 RepID=A0A2J5HW88_9EURO|nr:hypothetical protein BDW42DRAFT_90954 [Aspergillus taichungensis]
MDRKFCPTVYLKGPVAGKRKSHRFQPDGAGVPEDSGVILSFSSLSAPASFPHLSSLSSPSSSSLSPLSDWSSHLQFFFPSSLLLISSYPFPFFLISILISLSKSLSSHGFDLVPASAVPVWLTTITITIIIIMIFML